MAVNIKSPRVDELIAQLRQLTGRGATEIVREPLEVELQRQRRLRRIERLRQELPALQQQACTEARPFAPESLYDAAGLYRCFSFDQIAGFEDCGRMVSDAGEEKELAEV